MGAVAHRLLIDRRAQRLGDRRRLFQRVRSGDLVPGQQHRAPGGDQPVCEALQRLVRRTSGGVDSGRMAELQRVLLVENVPPAAR